MTTVGPSAVADESRRLSIRMPRPLWIGFAAVLLLLTSIGLCIGLPSYRQRAAIREIERVGGEFEIHLGGPNWLRHWVGDEWLKPFDIVVEVNFMNADGTDAHLVDLSALTRVEVLDLQNTGFTGFEAGYFRRLKQLRSLQLFRTKITDAGLEHLALPESVNSLCLADTGISDVGLRSLQRLPRLQELSLEGTGVTDNGLSHLKAHSRLEYLDLQGLPITDDGLEHLKAITSLRSLLLYRTRVTDSGVADLQRSLPTLEIYK